MTTVIDTNILVALWNEDDSLNAAAERSLSAAAGRGGLVISAPVYSELLAGPSRTERFLDTFLEDTGIEVEWQLSEATWRGAGRAFQRYAARRRKRGATGPRRMLADFLIGAHALQNQYQLLTLDAGFYRPAFPRLSVISM